MTEPRATGAEIVRARERRWRASVLGALVVPALLLAGCGSGGSDEDSSATEADTPSGSSTSDEGSPSQPPEPEVPTIDKAPFCDELTPAEISASAGDAKPAKLVTARKPGDKYEIFGQKQVATSWYCYWESERSGFGVTITEEPSDEKALRKRVADNASASGDATCRETEPASFGDPALGLSCSRKESNAGGTFSSGFAQSQYFGLFGDVDVFCQVSSADPQAIDRTDAALEPFCALALTAMTR